MYVPHYCTSLAVKFRIVFDCSAKSNDVSLSDKLFQGPTNYLTNSLLGVLLRFRQEQIAIVGDIKNMFYQVFVDRADRDACRFLWFPDGDLSLQPVSYRMNVHIFGCTSSPSVAAFALRKTASDNEAEVSAEAVSIVNNDFYVDDVCTSVSNVDDAKKILAQVSKLSKCGGFHLTKILSNNKQVLESVLPENRASSVVDLNNRELSILKPWEYSGMLIRIVFVLR